MKILKVTEREVQQMSKKGSKLAPFKEEIVVMKNMQVSSSSISKWLLENYQVVSTPQNISDYYARHKDSVDMSKLRFLDDNTGNQTDTIDSIDSFLYDDFDNDGYPNHEV